MDVYLNLGSNIGDSINLIGRAVALIIERFHPASYRLSPPFHSQPWGFESEHEFVNIGMGLRLNRDMEPLDVLHRIKDIEKSLSSTPHRNPDGTYRDRELDIDIIEIPGVELDTPELTLPHPRAHQRDFVMIPLSQSRL